MMQSQLGRITLATTPATADEATMKLDPEGGYGDLDEIVAMTEALLRNVGG